jgi:hypothetical protein
MQPLTVVEAEVAAQVVSEVRESKLRDFDDA